MKQLSVYKCYNKIAVMGGTFNPIHIGHLVAAEAVRRELGIERVIFIPTGNAPHKENDPMYNEHRYLMTVLATVANPYFEVSRTEIDRTGKSYTIDTIKELRLKYGEDCNIYFITGADAIEQILTWKDPEELLSICRFVAVTRPGYDRTRLEKAINTLKQKYKGNIEFLEVPALSISSTDIRNRVAAGKTIKYLVPEAVEKYILKFGLYFPEYPRSALISHINEDLRNILTPKRFKHTQGVAEEAVKLAHIYNEDEDKAYLAGLLHDCAKCYTDEEKLQLCHKYNVPLDRVIKKQPDLAHSFLGGAMAKAEYGVEDEDIINAICYHTTGRANMSLLEKIIYIADYIEPNREYFPGLEEVRQLAYTDIDKAVERSLQNTIEHNINKKRIIHPLSAAALEYYREENNEK